MSHTKQTFALSTLAAAVLAAYGPAMAADDGEIKALTQPDSWVSLGAGVLMGDERRQLGIVGGLRETGGYLLLDADVNMRDEATGTWTRLQATNLGMDSREARFEFEQQANQGVALEYRQSNREVPYEINTGVTGLGTANQNVPTRCTAPGVPVGCYEVGTGRDYQLGTERKKYGLEYFKYLMPELKFKAGYSEETKEGDRHARVGGQPEFAAQPIDWKVRKVDAALDYVKDKFQLSGGYSGSWFINDNDLLTAIRGGTPYYISQPLDSEAHQFYLNGGYNFTPTTRGTFKLSYTHATQDEHIPTADIPGLAWAGAPNSLNGEINTTLIELGLTARPLPKLSVLANLRYHDVNEKTPDATIINTISGGDQVLVDATPLDYETLTGKLEASYQLPQYYTLIAGIDYTKQDRTVPYGSDVVGGPNTAPVGDPEPDGADDQRYVPWRADLKETTYRLQLRKMMHESLTGALAFLYSKRDGSDYREAIHSEPGEGIHHDAIDPVNIADRDRKKVRLSVDWLPAEALNLQFNYEQAKDDYSGHTYGLREGKAWLVSADATYSINKDWQVTAWYSHDVTQADQHNHRFASGTYSEAEMYTDLEDVGDSVGLGIKGLVNPKLKVGADVQWTRIKNKYDQDIVPTGPGTLYEDPAGALNSFPLEDINSTLTRVKFFAEYVLNKKAEVRFDAMYERWKSDDWTWDFSDGSSFIFNDGTMVTTWGKQESTFLGMRYKYHF